MTVAVRSLLRFLHLNGLIARPLAQAVPMPARWRLAALPKTVGPGVLAALLDSCDRGAAARRDYAVLLLLSRLGLRAGEAAALQLCDVGWRDGTLRVRGKGSRIDVLPLPPMPGRRSRITSAAGGPAKPAGRCSAGSGHARRAGAKFGDRHRLPGL